MMPHSSILDRFRPVGAPGPVGPAGVPSTGEYGPGVELVPVFLALVPIIRAADEMVEHAGKDAADILEHARDEAAALLAQAQLDSRSARAAAAARVADDSATHDASVLAKAQEEARTLTARGREMLPAMTQAVVDRMLAGLRQP